MTVKIFVLILILTSSFVDASTKKQFSRADFEQTYEKEIKPIFAKSCLECHSQNAELPWFHKIPFVKTVMDSHTAEAQSHLDLTNGFKNIENDQIQFKLDLISMTVKNDLMPPKAYRLSHGISLTEKDKEAVEKWISKSRVLLTLD